MMGWFCFGAEAAAGTRRARDGSHERKAAGTQTICARAQLSFSSAIARTIRSSSPNPTPHHHASPQASAAEAPRRRGRLCFASHQQQPPAHGRAAQAARRHARAPRHRARLLRPGHAAVGRRRRPRLALWHRRAGVVRQSRGQGRRAARGGARTQPRQLRGHGRVLDRGESLCCDFESSPPPLLPLHDRVGGRAGTPKSREERRRRPNRAFVARSRPSPHRPPPLDSFNSRATLRPPPLDTRSHNNNRRRSPPSASPSGRTAASLWTTTRSGRAPLAARPCFGTVPTDTTKNK